MLPFFLLGCSRSSKKLVCFSCLQLISANLDQNQLGLLCTWAGKIALSNLRFYFLIIFVSEILWSGGKNICFMICWAITAYCFTKLIPNFFHSITVKIFSSAERQENRASSLWSNPTSVCFTQRAQVLSNLCIFTYTKFLHDRLWCDSPVCYCANTVSSFPQKPLPSY